jgi:hypothetical protein
MDKINEFDFEITYYVRVPGVENMLTDLISRILLNDVPGTVRSEAEYLLFLLHSIHKVSALVLASLSSDSEAGC